MPKIGTGGRGGGGRSVGSAVSQPLVNPETGETVDSLEAFRDSERGVLASIGDEIGDTFSGLWRAGQAIGGAIASDVADIGRLVPGGHKGFFEDVPEEAPDLLDDIGLGGLGRAIDIVEGKSEIVNQIVSPLAEDFANSVGQGFRGAAVPFIRDPMEAAARGLASLTGTEVDEDAGIVESALSIAERFGSDTAGELGERVAIDREEREGLYLIPVIQDVGNLAMFAGGVGVAARLGGGALTKASRLSGSSTLAGAGERASSVGRTASAVARRGTERGTAAVIGAGERVSPTGAALGQISRPLRSTVGRAVLGNDEGLVRAGRGKAYDYIQQKLDQRASGGDVDVNKFVQGIAERLNPERADALKMRREEMNSTRDSLNQIREGLEEGSVRADALRRLKNIRSYLTEDQYNRLEATYKKIAEQDANAPTGERLDLPQDIPTYGFGRSIPENEALGLLDAMAEAGIPLRRGMLPVEGMLKTDFRNHARDLLRLSLYESVQGMDAGTLTGSLRSVYELDGFAYMLGEYRPEIVRRLGEERAAELFSMIDGDFDSIRMMEQTLPNAADPNVVRRIEEAANSYREYQAGIESSRVGADLIPEDGIGSRTDAEGRPLPGDAPTRFDSEAPNAPNARRLAKATEDLAKADQNLKNLTKAIEDAGGLERLEELTQLREERAQIYGAITSSTKTLTQSGDLVNNPAVLDSVLAMMDDMIELGSTLDDMAGGKPDYLDAAEQRLRTAVNGVKEASEVKKQQMANGGTPVSRIQTNMRRFASLAREVNADNALETITGMSRLIDEIEGLIPEAGMDLRFMQRPLNELRRTLSSFDDVRNQRLTNQQRLKSLLIGEGIDGVTDTRSRTLVQAIVDQEVERIGTSDGAVRQMLNRIEKRLEIEEVPVNRTRLMSYLNEQMNSTAGRELRKNLPTNVPRERRQALKSLTAVTRDMTKVLDDADPIQQPLRELRAAERNLTAQRNKYLKNSNFAAEVKRAKNTAAERAKLQRHAVRAQQHLDEVRQEFSSSPAAVPASGRTIVKFAQTAVPKIVSELREMGDSEALRMADDLDTLPRNLEELQNARIPDPQTGEMRPLRITYVPDVVDSDDVIYRNRQRATDLRNTTPGMSRRRNVSNQPQVENPYDLAQKQAADTVRAIASQQLRDGFTEQFTRTAQDILTNVEMWDENISQDKAAKILREHGYVEYKPNELFGPFVNSRYTPPQGRWVKAEVADAMGKYTKPAGLFETLLDNTYDPILNVWRGAVLGLSPRWHVNNAIGNAALAMFAGHINPVDYFKFMATAVDLQRRAKEQGIDGDLRILKSNPLSIYRAAKGRVRPDKDVLDIIDIGEAPGLRDLFSNSLLAGESRDIFDYSWGRRGYERSMTAAREAGRADDASVVRRAGGVAAAGAQRTTDRIGKIVQGSFRINSAVDDMNRALIYIAKSFEDPITGRVNFAQAFNPEEGTRSAIQAFGAYNAMSPFERRILRRIFPFYSWMRHIGGVMFRHLTDISEIDRTILFGHIVNVLGEPNAEESLLPEWAESQVFTGYNEAGIPEFFNPRGTDPFSEGLAPFEALGSLREAGAFVGRSAGPAGSFVYENATGVDALQGNRLSGIEGPGGEPPDISLRQAAVEATPQGRLLRDYIRERRGDTRVRLDDDTPINIVRDPYTSKTVSDQFLRWMGISTVLGRGDPLPVEQMRAQELDNLRDYIRARERAEEPFSP